MAVVQVDVLMASRTMTISLPFLSVIIVVIVVFIIICGRVSLCDHHTQLASSLKLAQQKRKEKERRHVSLADCTVICDTTLATSPTPL